MLRSVHQLVGQQPPSPWPVCCAPPPRAQSRCSCEPGMHHLLGDTVCLLLVYVSWSINREFCLITYRHSSIHGPPQLAGPAAHETSIQHSGALPPRQTPKLQLVSHKPRGRQGRRVRWYFIRQPNPNSLHLVASLLCSHRRTPLPRILIRWTWVQLP